MRKQTTQTTKGKSTTAQTPKTASEGFKRPTEPRNEEWSSETTTKHINAAGDAFKHAIWNTSDKTTEDFLSRLRDTRESIIASLEAQENILKTQMGDSYSNDFLGIGSSNPIDIYNEWDLKNDALNWPLWLSLYINSWIFQKAINKPAQDIVNLNLKFHGVEESDKLQKVLKDFKSLKKNLIEVVQWGALYGGSVGVLLFDNVDLNKMDTQLTDDIVKTSTHLRILALDRWSRVSPMMSDLVDDSTSADFLKPRFYNIIIGTKSYKVHYSYILRYEHRTAPYIVQNGQLMGWGLPEGLHIINEITRDEKLKNSITSLVNKSLIEVIQMDGMKSAFMGSTVLNEKLMQKRLEMVNWGRHYNSITFLDTNDKYSQNTFSGLGGLSDLMEKNMKTMSAGVEMTGILYGDLSGGFSYDNYSLVRYDTEIRNKAESYYAPVLTKLLKILFLKYDINNPVDYDFDSMIQVREKKLEKAEKIIKLLVAMTDNGWIKPADAAREFMEKSADLEIGSSLSEEYIKQLEEADSDDNENAVLEFQNKFK